MPSQLTLKEDATFVPENAISLKHFPLNIRKVAKKILETDEPLRLKDACGMAKVNYNSFKVQVAKYRQKGLDFQTFIDEQANSFLKEEKMAVNRSLVNGAVSGSHNHQKLYYQLTGDLKETTNINIGALAIGININGLSGQDDTRDKGTIDVEPFIPKGK